MFCRGAIMKKKLLLLVLLSPAAPCGAEPLNYDYVYLSTNDTESDNGAENSGETLGGFWSFADTLHLFGSIDDAGAYTGLAQNPAWDYDTKTIRAGIGGHWLLGKQTMLAPSIAVLRSEVEVSAASFTRKYTDTGYGAQLDVRHALTNWFELTAGARYTHLFDEGTTELVGGVLFHPTNWLALGALYHEREEAASTELTVRWYY